MKGGRQRSRRTDGPCSVRGENTSVGRRRAWSTCRSTSSKCSLTRSTAARCGNTWSAGSKTSGSFAGRRPDGCRWRRARRQLASEARHETAGPEHDGGSQRRARPALKHAVRCEADGKTFADALESAPSGRAQNGHAEPTTWSVGASAVDLASPVQGPLDEATGEDPRREPRRVGPARPASGSSARARWCGYTSLRCLPARQAAPASACSSAAVFGHLRRRTPGMETRAGSPCSPPATVFESSETGCILPVRLTPTISLVNCFGMTSSRLAN